MSQRAAEDRAQMALAERSILELFKHLKAKYSDNREVQALLINFNGLRQQPEYVNNSKNGWTNGSLSPSTGIMELCPRNPDGTLRSKTDLLTTVTHELAHCMNSFIPMNNGHGPEWSKAFLWLSNVVVKDLKWNIRVQCRYCKQYHICNPGECSGCTWECSGVSRPPSEPLPIDKSPGFSEYPTSTYKRVCKDKKPATTWWKGICTEYERRNGYSRSGYGGGRYDAFGGVAPAPDGAPEPAGVEGPSGGNGWSRVE